MNNTNSSPSSKRGIPLDRQFTREHVNNLLCNIIGKTLGEIDVKGVLDDAVRTRPDKVVRGIAGDIIELSVLGCKRDSRPEPDIWVDNEKTELKTTGLLKTNKDNCSEYQAKEPLTITGVSPDLLKIETFENSRFYHKIEHLLFVFYHYALSSTARNSDDYRSFPILGHMFWGVKDEHLETLRNDWLLVQNFVRHFDFANEEERHKLKNNLLLIDYSSPHQPRFRFKRSFVSTIVDTFLKKRTLSILPQKITKFSDIDEKCHRFTEQHKGKTLGQLCDELNINITGKDACQRLIIKMFESNARSLNQIQDFSEIGLVAKTIILTSEGKRTEDMKMFKVDFDEWCSPNTVFKENENTADGLFETDYSDAYSFFAEQSFIFIVFEEPCRGSNIPLHECKFKGFKRFTFTESFINNDVKKTWDEVRRLVINKELIEEDKGRGKAPNFPKSSNNIVFLRGSGTNSLDRKKRLLDWGIDIEMYVQYVWVKGDYIVSRLNTIPYL